jgi:hypothetical protein
MTPNVISYWASPQRVRPGSIVVISKIAKWFSGVNAEPRFGLLASNETLFFGKFPAPDRPHGTDPAIDRFIDPIKCACHLFGPALSTRLRSEFPLVFKTQRLLSWNSAYGRRICRKGQGAGLTE